MRDEGSRAAQPQDLLAWYDSHARVLPWRISPQDRAQNIQPDPYRVWLSEVMLQQTTVAMAKSYFLRFTTLWPTVQHLAAARDEAVMGEWAGLGYYARARNLLKCARAVVDQHGGEFPRDHAALLLLPGIGPYTAAAVAAIAYDHAETVVDGNVERVMARLHNVHEPLPGAKAQLTILAASLTPAERPGDYAQAVMDLGATLCTPWSPKCDQCPWQAPCAARGAGTAADLPRKTPKKPKPTRQGIVYVGRRSDGAWLLERRPDKGLLGGMLGWPGTDWAEVASDDLPPLQADWREVGVEARHTFTHFHLKLAVRVAQLPMTIAATNAAFVPTSEFRRSDLPTVMRKAFDLALDALNTAPNHSE